MSTTEAPTPEATGPVGAPSRMRALARAELTLLVRNRTALFMALAMPVLITVGMQQTVREMDLGGTGLSVGTVLLPASIGYVLLFAVYTNLVSTYVARREELVFKRLRTGEMTDGEILAGSAVPAVLIGVAQCVLLLVGGAAALGLTAPERPGLVLLGVVFGMVMMVVAAAASTLVTRSTEAAQLTVMPLIVVSLVCSGVVVPLESLPERIADVCVWLPLSPLMELVRGGWTGSLDGGEALRAAAVAAVWTLAAVYAVRRWFHWEPRR